MKNTNCRIITVYLPEADLAVLDLLCNEGGYYTSRSEAVRVAVHAFCTAESVSQTILKLCGIATALHPPQEPEPELVEPTQKRVVKGRQAFYYISDSPANTPPRVSQAELALLKEHGIL